MAIVVLALFAFGYPVSIIVIARFVPVVRERRLRWFVWHQSAVAAIVLGFGFRERWSAVAVNGTWFVVAAIWYRVGAPTSGNGQVNQAM